VLALRVAGVGRVLAAVLVGVLLHRGRVDLRLLSGLALLDL
jgi:hypothetical protein